MFDPERLLQQMVGGALGGAFGGRTRSRGGLSSALGGGKAQLGLGLLGVAIAAYGHYSKSQPAAARPASVPAPGLLATQSPPPPPPPQTPPPPPPASAPTRAQPMLDLRKQEAALIVRAMIAAAAADGLIDASERAEILRRAQREGDDPDTLSYLEAELARPVDVEQLIAQTPRSLAESVYAASALAIAVDTEAERAYLDRLANGLGIDASLREQLHAQVGLA